MVCERCGDNVMAGRLVVRRTFAGFACHPCADEVKRLDWEERNMAKKNGGGKKGRKAVARTDGAGREGSLAAIIDPLLFAGGKTIKEIALEVATKGGSVAKGKDLQANVRARMVSYRRKGYRIEKDKERRVKLLEKKA